MIDIIPPQSLGEGLAWTSALITIVFGLICFFAPRTTYKILRLRTEEGVPEALSESRGTMAGFYLATGILAILFGQPVIWMLLGAGWAFTALGRLVSIIFDRGNTSFNWVSFAIEIVLATMPLAYALGYFRMEIMLPQSPGEWLGWTSATITILFGLICFFAPRTTYKILRLRTVEGVPEALSESRATMSGFYLAFGLLVILPAKPFVLLVLGAGWAFTALGRLVSIIFDRGNTSFNWISITIEAALALMPLAYVFGYIR